MHAYRRAVASAIVAIGAVACVMVANGQDRLPLGPPKASGQAISPAFEGWFKNADGSFTLLFGHFNRNSVQTFDIPVGPNNRFEPAPADRGQPTYFGTGRGYG